MKPEPLTNEKINIKEIMKQYRYLTSVRRQIDFRDGFNHALSLIESAVQWLLKEIEKEINQWEHLNDEYVEGLKFAYNKIKKAFEGVIEE